VTAFFVRAIFICTVLRVAQPARGGIADARPEAVDVSVGVLREVRESVSMSIARCIFRQLANFADKHFLSPFVD
jgi:hypothetical protein